MNLSQSSFNWVFRYKLYHIPFWALYHYFWWSIASGDPITAANNLFYPPHTVKFLFYVCLQALGVYYCLYRLIPNLLEKGRYYRFIASLAVLILVTSALIVSGYYFSAYAFQIDFYELFKVQPEDWIFLFKSNAFPSTIAAMTLGMSIKLGKNWLSAQRKQQILEKEKLETELKFLRSQFNPHFLFNTINSIFVLIDKNPVMASESLAKFSGLLRYQLYECNEAQIPLSREITYLQSFIELERLRQNDNIDIEVQIDSKNSGDLLIAPFILMPFIENAFKHVSIRKDEQNIIQIKLQLQGNKLIFTVNNTKSSLDTQEFISYGGLGLKNVQRRLNILYPEKHNLDISNLQNSFSIHLTLELAKSENILPKAAHRFEVDTN